MRPRVGTPNPREVELRCAEKKKRCFWPAKFSFRKRMHIYSKLGTSAGTRLGGKSPPCLMHWECPGIHLPSLSPMQLLLVKGQKTNDIRFDSHHSAAKRWCVVDGYFAKSLHARRHLARLNHAGSWKARLRYTSGPLVPRKCHQRPQPVKR